MKSHNQLNAQFDDIATDATQIHAQQRPPRPLRRAFCVHRISRDLSLHADTDKWTDLISLYVHLLS
jgi:hypothetical protein